MPVGKVVSTLIGLNAIAATIGVLLALFNSENPAYYFNEGTYISWLSFTQLMSCAVIAWHVGKAQKRTLRSAFNSLWWILTGGLAFLAIDEVGEIHERIEDWLIQGLSLGETWWAVRIDDAVVALYCIIALAILWRYGPQLRQHYRQAIPLFIAGIAVGCLMVVLDTISNRPDTVTWIADAASLFMQNYDARLTLMYSLRAAEETAKLFAESLFLGGLYCCLLRARVGVFGKPVVSSRPKLTS